MYQSHVAARDPANALGLFLQAFNDHQQALEWLQVCACMYICICVSPPLIDEIYTLTYTYH